MQERVFLEIRPEPNERRSCAGLLVLNFKTSAEPFFTKSPRLYCWKNDFSNTSQCKGCNSVSRLMVCPVSLVYRTRTFWFSALWLYLRAMAELAFASHMEMDGGVRIFESLRVNGCAWMNRKPQLHWISECYCQSDTGGNEHDCDTY